MEDNIILDVEQTSAIRIVADEENETVQLQAWVGGLQHPPMTWKARIELAWSILRTGEPYPDYYNFGKENAGLLAIALWEVSGDIKDEKRVGGFSKT